ncbi:MAG: hypothetical protein QOH16_2059 [Gaiellaceae bacterium]|jgi:hypothetical protein|nr:hypothetical protein [Gaiellaceae bacterium]
METFWPFRKSFRPENAQIEFACAGAPVAMPEPEPGTPGVPGGPITSPANAAPELAPATAMTHTAAEKKDFVRMSYVPFSSNICCLFMRTY